MRRSQPFIAMRRLELTLVSTLSIWRERIDVDSETPSRPPSRADSATHPF
jgi:hypothetical protein